MKACEIATLDLSSYPFSVLKIKFKKKLFKVSLSLALLFYI